ncbi:hypothetical protein P8452_24049 [Trifolium repens]|nr:hypothetical protein P8452_24049 [Trifolium repens]
MLSSLLLCRHISTTTRKSRFLNSLREVVKDHSLQVSIPSSVDAFIRVEDIFLMVKRQNLRGISCNLEIGLEKGLKPLEEA